MGASVEPQEDDLKILAMQQGYLVWFALAVHIGGGPSWVVQPALSYQGRETACHPQEWSLPEPQGLNNQHQKCFALAALPRWSCEPACHLQVSEISEPSAGSSQLCKKVVIFVLYWQPSLTKAVIQLVTCERQSHL